MEFSIFTSYISCLQKTGLFGRQSHYKLAPEYRKKDYERAIKENHPQAAAVLLLVFPNKNNKTSFVLTKRAQYDGHHSKQMSFPGGKKDVSDNSLLASAIRETSEEIGIELSFNSTIKQLSDLYIPPSNFLVTPFLVWIDYTPIFKTNHEVDRVITPTLDELLDNTKIKTKLITAKNGQKILTPYFDFYGEIVWGATAMILSELKDLINTCKGKY